MRSHDLSIAAPALFIAARRWGYPVKRTRDLPG